ncbi:MAG: YdeI family protein [Thermoleophilia bacterium]
MGATDDLPRFHPETRAEWRAWLAENHATAPGVWFVNWKRGTGRPSFPYGEAVEEALCVGWIDSLKRTLDEERSVQLYTPPRRGSGWSRSNKERLVRLEAEGLMLPAGVAVVDAAKADGSWTLLDDVEALVEPPDLTAALDAVPGARANWDGFPASAKRLALYWIVQAKRPETRAKRVAETARLAGEGKRAG